MIKLENYEVMGWEHAIRGMRNPMNSWEKSDSCFSCIEDDCSTCCYKDIKNIKRIDDEDYIYCDKTAVSIGENDHDLAMRLAKAGPVHGKFRRMITVYVDITAPLYWWKEFDTYKVGTVANSCSTMHKIHAKEFTMADFSRNYLDDSHVCVNRGNETFSSWDILKLTVDALNFHRNRYLETEDKYHWWQMIQLLPSSYNQKRTVMLNYEVLANIYEYRKDHKLDEWRKFCQWIEQLPYSEIITGSKEEK